MATSPETGDALLGRHEGCTESDTVRIGGLIADRLERGSIVTLSGPLGSGKSVLARAVAGALGVPDRMPSPSYTIVEEYEGRLPVIHIDLYRISDEDEFTMLGIDDLIGESVSLIEWPERAPSLLDSAALRVRIETDDDPALRTISVTRGTL